MTLHIRLKKATHGPATLTCTRADGSATYQRLHDAFPVHDLTHYAVETELGARDGFFGLIAQGWNLTDFDKPWPKGSVPAEGLWVEAVVGAIWTAHLTHQELPVPSRHEALKDHPKWLEAVPDRNLTDDELARIRARFAELQQRWVATPAGGELVLEFRSDSLQVTRSAS